MTAAIAPTPLEVSGAIHPDPDTWVLRFAYTTNPLPMNGSRGKSFYGKAATGKAIRLQAKYSAKALAEIPPLGRCRAQLTWWVKDARTRDADNLAEFEKRLFDGLVDAGVVADDKPALMEKPRGEIRHLRDAAGLVTAPCFTLTITRLPSEEAS